jgi:type IV pilus assembly protein PilP
MKTLVQHRCIFTAILTLAGFLCLQGVQTQANEHPENKAQQAASASTLRGYHQFDYKFIDRPDPFLPFFDVKKENPKNEGEKIIDPKAVLAELQKYEPGQLTLVAVLAFQDKNIAMLEDETGEGHLAEQDTLIGRHGVITSIEKNKLLVTETYKTTTGRTVVNKIPLYMQQQD